MERKVYVLPMRCSHCLRELKDISVTGVFVSFSSPIGELMLNWICECGKQVSIALPTQQVQSEPAETLTPNQCFPALPKGSEPTPSGSGNDQSPKLLPAASSPAKIKWTTQDHKFLKALKIETDQDD